MAKARRGLGKGLDSMIPQRVEQPKKETKETVVETKVHLEENVSRETFVKITDIEPNKDQPRRRFNEDALHELAESIKQYGVLQPLLLQKKGKTYEITSHY